MVIEQQPVWLSLTLIVEKERRAKKRGELSALLYCRDWRKCSTKRLSDLSSVGRVTGLVILLTWDDDVTGEMHFMGNRTISDRKYSQSSH